MLHHSLKNLRKLLAQSLTEQEGMPNVDFSFPKKFPLNLIGSPKKDKDRRMFEEYTEDTWSISMDGKHLIRYHNSPRNCSILEIPTTSLLTSRPETNWDQQITADSCIFLAWAGLSDSGCCARSLQEAKNNKKKLNKYKLRQANRSQKR